jgi:hypothetical protein
VTCAYSASGDTRKQAESRNIRSLPSTMTFVSAFDPGQDAANPMKQSPIPINPDHSRNREQNEEQTGNRTARNSVEHRVTTST